MKRRDFLKLLTVVPLAPSVLAAAPKDPEKSVGMPDDLCISFDAAELAYFYVGADLGESGSNCTYTLYGITNDGNYVKIDDYSFVDNGDGRYNINIPEGVLRKPKPLRNSNHITGHKEKLCHQKEAKSIRFTRVFAEAERARARPPE